MLLVCGVLLPRTELKLSISAILYLLFPIKSPERDCVVTVAFFSEVML